MQTNELLQKIKLIEIKTRGLTRHVFSGQYHSSFKGRGMAFSEVREYQVGDEVRTIDWNVTARFHTPFVKVFEEERELTVMLLIDVSGSGNFGTHEKTKKDLALEIAAVLAFSAVANNDKVGAIFISDQVEKFIAPAKGKKHALLILREMIEFQPKSKGTNLNEGLRFFRNALKKRSIAFVISDFMDTNPYTEGLSISRRKHDMIALRLVDPAEYDLPDLGMIELFNAETGQKTWVNSSSESTRQAYRSNYAAFESQVTANFSRHSIAHATLDTISDYIPTLVQLFQSRK
jgi:uncharacterized protein (DUF58 family)